MHIANGQNAFNQMSYREQNMVLRTRRSQTDFERLFDINNHLQNSNNQRVQVQLNEQTKKLFKAIDDKNLEDFRQALEQGADVNAFGVGHTPFNGYN